MKSASLVLLLGIQVLAASGCTSDEFPLTIVRNQASYDFDCARDQIKVAPIGNHRFTAEGCFKREIYICSSGLFLPDNKIECNQQVTPLPTFDPPGDKDN